MGLEIQDLLPEGHRYQLLRGLVNFRNNSITVELRETLTKKYCPFCSRKSGCAIRGDLERQASETFHHPSLIVLCEHIDAFTEEGDDYSYSVLYPVCVEYQEQQKLLPGLENIMPQDFIYPLLKLRNPQL